VNRPRPSGAAAGGGQTIKAVIVVAVVVIVGFLILKNGFKSSPSAAGTSPTTVRHVTTTTAPLSTTTQPLISPANIKLQVLNGVGTGQLAGQWSAKLHANPGYNTLTALDATAVGLAKSEIFIITPGYTQEADALATQVGLTPAIVVPTIPPPLTAPIPATARANANLVLVIGRDLAASA
jgi:hypothetical protein